MGLHMKKKKEELEFRFYEIPQNQPVLALLGEKWVQHYGSGVDRLHFHNYMEIGYCYGGEGEASQSTLSGSSMENSFFLPAVLRRYISISFSIQREA